MPRRPVSSLDKIPTAPRAPGRRVSTPQTRNKRGASKERPLLVDEVRARGMDTTSYENCALIDVNKPLTQMQKDFVRYWAQGESVITASNRAGYADGSVYAYRMIRMPNILALYNAEKALYEEAAGMTRKKVMDMLLEAYQDAKMINEPASMVSAAREIGKMCGYYEPVRIKVDVNHTGNVQFSRMSDAELLQLITEGPRPDHTLALTN